MTGSAHDASAFEHTAAMKHTGWFFEGEEFAWVDSACPIILRTIPVHKRPASLLSENTLFDGVVANLCVRSEHCIGALKGCWQCLWGLCVNINSKQQHQAACWWITVAIILHNLVIDIEGAAKGAHFSSLHTSAEEEEDRGVYDLPVEEDVGTGDIKRHQLIEELLAFKHL